MTDFPPLAIALLTCNRTEIALRTVLGLVKNLVYPGKMGWYVAVDSRNYEHSIWITQTLGEHGQEIIGQHCDDFVPGQPHAGASWNIALKSCMKWADFVLWMEDDWELTMKMDITAYINLLAKHEDIGMVRLGLMPIMLDLHSIGRDGNIYLDVLNSTPYRYSGNPHLRHKRFVDAYGYFATDRNPGDMEVELDHRIRHTEGPKIVFPWESRFGTYSAFAHIGGEKTF